jgi:hypothetical protein
MAHTPIALSIVLNEQEMRKLEALKVGGVQKEKKKKKTHFIS